MTTPQTRFLVLYALLAVYLLFEYVLPFGGLVLYPFKLFATYLHELGHALGCLITGGDVVSLQVNQDGSGVTYTSGGIRAIVLMGGYIGSALLGNFLLYHGVRDSRIANWIIYAIAICMFTSAIVWHSSLFSTALLGTFSIGLYFLSKSEIASSVTLMFLGAISVFHIIQDFNVGPTSDLAKYAEIFVIIPTTIWMYIWLAIVLAITYFNIQQIRK